jgi:uncharacterized protein (TIGR03086 family)
MPADIPLVEAEAADKHRRIAAVFSARTEGVLDWAAPTPVAGWTAHDVVEHLTTWFPAFLRTGTGIELPAGPAASEDPAGAWRSQTDAIQALLDDPGSHEVVFSTSASAPRPAGGWSVYTSDVFLHWDLARATGQDDVLDLGMCAQLLAGMEPMAEMLYASGQYGPRVPVPEGSDVQTRLLGLIGRDPAWRPPT